MDAPGWSRSCAATPPARCATTRPRASCTRRREHLPTPAPWPSLRARDARRSRAADRRLPRPRRAAHHARRGHEPRRPGGRRGPGGGLLGPGRRGDRPGRRASARGRPGRGARRPERRPRPRTAWPSGPTSPRRSRATLGGMIANNSAGARSVAHGLTADHVLALDVTLADGTRATLRRGRARAGRRSRRPARLAAAARPPGAPAPGLGLRPRRPRAATEPDWPRLLCGSRGHAGRDPRGRLRLVERPAARGLALLPLPLGRRGARGGRSALLEAGPSAIELMDRSAARPGQPPPDRGALLGFAGDARPCWWSSTAASRARWRPAWAPSRRAGRARPGRAGGGVGRAPGGHRQRPARRPGGAGDPRPLAFVEDPAVPPERLPGFARGMRACSTARASPPSGTGTRAWAACTSARDGPAGARRRRAALRRIAEEIADLVAAHGGSLSGEHGDGRARSELLPRMYPPETIAAFAELKRAARPGRTAQPRGADRPRAARRRTCACWPRRRGAPRRTAMSFAAEGGPGPRRRGLQRQRRLPRRRRRPCARATRRSATSAIPRAAAR